MKENVKALQADVSSQLRCLVSLKGYGYARNVATQIAKEFECKPTDPNWQVYTTVKWSLDKLFIEIEKLASYDVAQTPKEVMADANNRRNTRRRKTASSNR